MIRVSRAQFGKVLYVHIRRTDTYHPTLMEIGADIVPSERQARLRFKRALKIETAKRKF